MITVVSGLPRSGTSLMMQILRAGGMEILTDNKRSADENNSKGYYEYEKVKSLIKDNTWLSEAEGKAVKIIVQLLHFLPNQHEYKIIFMERDIDEVVLSQNKMIDKLNGKQTTIPHELLKKTFLTQVEKVKTLLAKNANLVYVDYHNLLNSRDEEIDRINTELDLGLNVKQACQVIDKTLYRTKK